MGFLKLHSNNIEIAGILRTLVFTAILTVTGTLIIKTFVYPDSSLIHNPSTPRLTQKELNNENILHDQDTIKNRSINQIKKHRYVTKY